jgi:hypothetical protein
VKGTAHNLGTLRGLIRWNRPCEMRSSDSAIEAVHAANAVLGDSGNSIFESESKTKALPYFEGKDRAVRQRYFVPLDDTGQAARVSRNFNVPLQSWLGGLAQTGA